MLKSLCPHDPSNNARIEYGIFPCPHSEKQIPFCPIEMTPEETVLYIMSFGNAS